MHQLSKISCLSEYNLFCRAFTRGRHPHICSLFLDWILRSLICHSYQVALRSTSSSDCTSLSKINQLHASACLHLCRALQRKLLLGYILHHHTSPLGQCLTHVGCHQLLLAIKTSSVSLETIHNFQFQVGTSPSW